MERRHVACLAAAALLLTCWIVQIVLIATAQPDLLRLSLEDVAGEIRAEEPAAPLRIAVFMPAGDESGAVDAAIRARFKEKSGWKVLDRELMEEALRDYGATLQTKPRTGPEAVAAGKKLGVEAALFAEATRYRQDDKKAEVALKWGIVKVPSGDLMEEGAASREMEKGFFALDSYRAKVDSTATLFRIFLWLMTVLTLPVALLPVDELVLRLRTNAAAAGLLAGYTVAAFALMLVLNGFRLFSITWGILAVLALVGTALYTLAVLNALAED